MKQIVGCVINALAVLGVVYCAGASGSAYQSRVFATAGAEPGITIVVTDSNGLGCQAVPVSISVTAGDGIPEFTAASTEADGTTKVAVSGSSLGDTINIYCGQVTTGLSNTVTASAARGVVSTDTVVAWFDEARHTVKVGVIDPGTNVMVTVSSGSIDYNDIYSPDADTKQLTFAQLIQQDEEDYPYSREVFQGTYDTNNIIYINVDDISGSPDATIGLSSLTYNRLLKTYATGGANPKVVAVIIDRAGRGISGVTITAQSSAGAMTPAFGMTNAKGTITFFQTGGALGNTITVAGNLSETLAVSIITEDSVPVSADSKVFTWFERKTRMIYTAITERTTNVLVQDSIDILRNYDELSGDPHPYPGNYIEQTSQRPGSSYVVYGGSEAGDLIRIYQNGTVYRYDGSYNSIITMPANESRYLMACAAGGTDPLIWAIVIDENGNAVKDVPLTFNMYGSGSLALANTITVWSGIARNKVNGGSIGNTITVSSPGLGEGVIYLSDVRTAGSVDRMYNVYDPETHMVYAAVVHPENNVMTDTFSVSTVRGYLRLDQTPGNGVNASISLYFHPQSDIKLCQGYTGFGTIGAGDILGLYFHAARSYAPYNYIRAGAEADEYFLAFAMSGTTPEVWAVVMDKYGNAVPNKTINFSTTGGSLSTATGTTNYGGYLTAEATAAINYGNTITVSSPGLPPVNIWTSPGSNYSSSDMAFMWYDPTTLLLRNACFEIDKKIVTNNAALADAEIQVIDNSANGRNIGKGATYNQDGDANPARIGIAYLCCGTPGVGDIIRTNFFYSSTYNVYESFITIQSLNTLYLHAYAEQGSSPNIVAVITDADGNALPDINVSFAALTAGGSMESTPVGGFKTGINGNVKAQYTENSGYYEKIRVTTPDFNSAPIDVITYNENDIQTCYKAIPHYNQYQHKVNVVFAHQYFNCVPNNSVAIETITAIDQSENQKNLSVSALENQASNMSAYAYLGFGTNAVGDQISINDTTAEGSPDALITLKPDVEKYLFAFGTGGASPTTITAVIVDKNGNGLAGEEIVFTPSGGSLSLTHTATDASGTTKTVLYGSPPLGTTVTISAPNSVSYTVVVQTADSVGVAANSRVYPWYSVLERKSRAAIVSLNNNILTSTSVMTFTPQDMTDNGKAFALGAANQQSGINPANVSVINGTQGEGDMIVLGESITIADPEDAILTISVPTSEIISSITGSPGAVSVGQNITVAMSVFNNGSPAALTVTPSALNVAGGAAYSAGPTPGVHYVIDGGTSENFEWTYIASAPGDVIFTGQAFGTDSFTMSGITSTATDSNTILVQTPAALTCNISGPDNVERLCDFTLSMTVNNTGEAAALNTRPSALLWTSGGTPAGVSITSGPSPSGAVIPGSQNQVFTWTCAAGEQVGTLVFSNSAQGWDANSGNTITANSADSNTINVLQGALNLDRISSPDTQVYQGQAGLEATMYVRNTSLMHVTLTASGLNFNGSQQGFVVLPAAGNPSLAAPESAFELKFIITINKDAPLGNVVIDGTVSGDAETGAMSANGAQETANWEVLEPFNSLRQNYPNPLRLAQNDCTTFEYFVREDADVSMKIYNLAGELAAILYEGRPGVGKHTVEWYGDNGEPGRRGQTVGSGVYLAVFKIGDYQETKKVVVIR